MECLAERPTESVAPPCITAAERNEDFFRAIFGNGRSPSDRPPDGLCFPNDDDFKAGSWVGMGTKTTNLWWAPHAAPDAPFLWITEGPARLVLGEGLRPWAPQGIVATEKAIPYRASIRDWEEDAASQLVAVAKVLAVARITPPASRSIIGPEWLVPSMSCAEVLRFDDKAGEYARITALGGKDEELAYWDVAEFAEDPTGVWGAILGSMQSGTVLPSPEA
jgi:hypothetical protein